MPAPCAGPPGALAARGLVAILRLGLRLSVARGGPRRRGLHGEVAARLGRLLRVRLLRVGLPLLRPLLPALLVDLPAGGVAVVLELDLDRRDVARDLGHAARLLHLRGPALDGLRVLGARRRHVGGRDRGRPVQGRVGRGKLGASELLRLLASVARGFVGGDPTQDGLEMDRAARTPVRRSLPQVEEGLPECRSGSGRQSAGGSPAGVVPGVAVPPGQT